MEETVFSQEYEVKQKVKGNRYLIIIDADGKLREISLDSFRKESLLLGRDPGKCEIVIPFAWVSRVHGKFLLKGEKVFFADADSLNGTILDVDGYRRFINGNKEYCELHNGNILRIQSEQSNAGNSVMLLYVNRNDAGVWSRISLLKGDVTIGRDRNSSIVLSHPGVSRCHAMIKRQEKGFVLIDHNSMNGILVNGQRIEKIRRLEEKDVIQILNSTLIYTDSTILYKSSVRGIHIEVNDLNKYVGKNKKILDRVNCRIESNEFVAVIGGSGAGKTTFMNAVNGFDRNVRGNITYNGINLRKNFSELKNLIGYVPQEDIIYENLTLRSMLYFTARLKMPKDTSKEEISERIDRVLDMVELSEHQDTFIRKLSGGQKKRASIAVELLADPSVFFLDEPTSGLDPGTEQKLMITLSRLAKTQGKTIVMVTHTTQSLQLCDKVIFMGKGGRMCFCGTTEQAKAFFHTEDLVSIYNMIFENPKEWAEKYDHLASLEDEGTNLKMDGDDENDGPGAFRRPVKHVLIGQVPVLLLRYVKLICNDFPRLMLLFLQPVAIAVLLAIVANENVFKIFEDTRSVLFSLSCAAIWIGLFNSIQEICKERAILKREYMGNLKLPYYILSKFMVQTVIGLLQAFLIVTVFTVTVGSPDKGILSASPFGEILVTVWLTIEASMALGFVISAFVKSGDKAMTIAPFILIVQLLFSGILFELKGAGEYIAYITISKWSVESLGSTADLNSLQLRIQEQLPNAEHEFQKIFEHTQEHLLGHWGILAGMMIVCAVVCTLILRSLSRDGR